MTTEETPLPDPDMYKERYPALDNFEERRVKWCRKTINGIEYYLWHDGRGQAFRANVEEVDRVFGNFAIVLEKAGLQHEPC